MSDLIIIVRDPTRPEAEAILVKNISHIDNAQRHEIRGGDCSIYLRDGRAIHLEDVAVEAFCNLINQRRGNTPAIAPDIIDHHRARLDVAGWYDQHHAAPAAATIHPTGIKPVF